MSGNNGALGSDILSGGPDTSRIFLHDPGSRDLLSEENLTKVMVGVWPGAVSAELLSRWQQAAQNRVFDAIGSPFGTAVGDSIAAASEMAEESARIEKSGPAAGMLSEMRELGWDGSDEEAAMWAAMRCAIMACAVVDVAMEFTKAQT